MDIRCPACATLYELDEAQIAPGGTNIRCSSCGQIFRVRASDPAKSSCMVKRALTGEITHFDDLRTLQRWISDARIAPDDWISKSGQTWKHLYEIEEIAAWFTTPEVASGRIATPGETLPPRAPASPNATFQMAGLGGDATVVAMPGLKDGRATPATVANPGLTPRPTAATPATASRIVPRQPVAPPIQMRPRGLTPAAVEPVRPARSSAPAAGEWSIGDAPISEARPSFSRGGDTASVLAVANPPSRAGGLFRGAALIAVGVAVGVLFAKPQLLGLDADPITLLRATGADAADGADGVPAPTEAVVAPIDAAPAVATGTARPVPDVAEASGMAPAGSGDGAQIDAAAIAPAAAEVADVAAPVPPADQGDDRPQRSSYESLMADAARALDEGDATEALALYERAADSEDRAEAHTGVARAYQSLGRRDLAAARFRRALERNSRYSPAWLGLGDVLSGLGDTQGAIDAYEQVVTIVPSGSMRDRAERALRALR
jgi:predicted Zn finger-like uncharacterized protein